LFTDCKINCKATIDVGCQLLFTITRMRLKSEFDKIHYAGVFVRII